MKSWIYYIITACLALAGCANSAKIQLFDDADFKGLFYDIESSQLNDSQCVQLPPHAHNKLSSIRTNGACVMLFNDISCNDSGQDSFTARVGPYDYFSDNLEYVEFDNVVKSLRLCDEEKGEGRQVNVKLFGSPYLEDQLVEYNNLCGCVNLPSSFVADAVGSIDNGGSCVEIFHDENCYWEDSDPFVLRGGKSAESQDLKVYMDNQSVKSIRGCYDEEWGSASSCLKLDVTIFKVELSVPELKMSLEDVVVNATSELVQIAPKSVITNHATCSSVTQEYHASTIIHEEVSIDMPYFSFRPQINFGVVENLVVDSKIEGIPLLGGNSMKHIFRAAFDSSSEPPPPKSSKVFFHQEDREVGVMQQIQIRPCRHFEVSSTATIIHDHPANFNFYAKISGELGGVPMNWEQLQEYGEEWFEFVDYDYDDEFGVIGKYSYGTMRASFSQDVSVSGQESQVEGCIPEEDNPTSPPATDEPPSTMQPTPKATTSTTSEASTTAKGPGSCENNDEETQDDSFSIYFKHGAIANDGKILIWLINLVTVAGVAVTIALLVMIMKTLNSRHYKMSTDSQFVASYVS